MPTATKRPVETPKQADYGVDAPRDQKRLLTRGILLILLGAGFYAMNLDNSPSNGAALFSALGTIGVFMM